MELPIFTLHKNNSITAGVRQKNPPFGITSHCVRFSSPVFPAKGDHITSGFVQAYPDASANNVLKVKILAQVPDDIAAGDPELKKAVQVVLNLHASG